MSNELKSPLYVFAYDFPHRKTSDFLHLIASYGMKPVVVFSAPKKKLNDSAQGSISLGPDSWDRRLTRDICFDLGFQYIQTPHEDAHQIKTAIENSETSMALIAGARIIPADTISLFKQGIINFHPGKIPETSGLDSFYYSIKHNCPMGVTTHFIDHKVDSGLHIKFEPIDLKLDDSEKSLKEKIYQLQLAMLKDLLPDLADGKTLKTVKIDRPYKNKPMVEHEKSIALNYLKDYLEKQVSKNEKARQCQ